MAITRTADWIKEAGLDLDSFDLMYERKEYSRCLYHLQQASEKTFKAATIATGLSSDSNRGRAFMEKLGFPILRPEDYDHPLREVFLDQMKKASESSIGALFLEAVGIKDSKEKLAMAASLRDKRNPTEKEVAGLVADCNTLLDAFQNKSFRSSVDSTLAEHREIYDKMFDASLGEVTNEAFGKIRKEVAALPILDVGLILSIFLSPFETSRYPRHDSIEAFEPHLKGLQKVIERCISTLEASIS
jgi:hypothetical protein